MNSETANYVVINLTKGYSTIVSFEDGDLATLRWKTVITSSNIPRACRAFADPETKKQKTVLLSRLIIEREIERPLKRGELVDHRNGNSLDDRRENLRIATYAENARNKKKQSNNTSGYRGVYFSTKRNKWHATIQINRKRIHLGFFDTPEDAHLVYKKASINLHGEFSPFRRQ